MNARTEGFGDGPQVSVTPITGARKDNRPNLKSLIERCQAAQPAAADWLGLGAHLMNTSRPAAASAVSLAFEQRPQLLHHAQRSPSLAGAMQLLVDDRHRRMRLLLEHPDYQDVDPAARAMLTAELGADQPLPPHRNQQPFQSFYPGLPDKPWFDLSGENWVKELTAAHSVIRAEWESYQCSDGRTVPYISGPRHDGLTGGLNDDPAWSSLHIIDRGHTPQELMQPFHRTLSILSKAPLVRVPGYAPEVFFSRLAPKTQIPPHHGQTNWKLTFHVCIDDPEGCSITVRDEQRQTRPGECVVFDDSYLHEANNPSDQSRSHLVLEVWNPAVPESGRRLIHALHEDRFRWRTHRKAACLGAARRLLHNGTAG